MVHLIFSWNIDSVRPEKWDRLVRFIESERPSIVCLNETKSKSDNLKQLFESLEDYDYVINSHNPPQYHGVAILIHKDLAWSHLDLKLDCEARYDNRSKDPTVGRLIAIKLESVNFPGISEDVIIVATYSPNSGIDRTNPLKNLSYRIESWDRSLFEALNNLEKEHKNIIWIGDINVAPREIDVSHPKVFKRHAGFTQEERDRLQEFLETTSWIDVWRYQHPKEIAYTFKGYRNYRYRLRLDNCIITRNLLTRIIDSKIYPDKEFIESDHNPISISLSS